MLDNTDRAERGAGLVVAALALGLLAVFAVLALGTFAALRVRIAEHRWNEALGSPEELVERWPSRAANASALEAERLARELGIDLVPFSASRGRPSAAQREAFQTLKLGAALWSWWWLQLERAERGRIDAPPPELVAFLESHGTELEALRRQLVEGGVPLWETDSSKLDGSSLPNLLGQIDLHKLFAATALAELARGDRRAALGALEASYRLAGSLRDSPQLIGQLVFIAATRFQVGVLRHLPDPPVEWIERLEANHHRRTFLTAMRYEGWVLMHRDALTVWGDVWWNRLGAPVTRPYARLCLADLSDSWREQVAALGRVDSLCDHDLAAAGVALEIPVPRWNAAGDLLVTNLGDAVERLARLELGLELLRVLHEADAAGAAGEWLAHVGLRRRSTACPADDWLLSRTAEGRVIELSREPRWRDPRPFVPNRVVLH